MSTDPRMPDPYDDEETVEVRPIPMLPDRTYLQARDSVVTAQRVALPRDYQKIRREISERAQVSADRYVYSWPVKDRQTGRTERIFGATIGLAYELLEIYQNAAVDCRVEDHGDYWIFYGRFVDWERGISLTRPYMQRKTQNIGMRDQGRADDIVFQIGVSKAERNAIVNALRSLADFAVEEANDRIPKWVEANVDRARDRITGVLEDMDVPLNRVEKVVGRPFAKWTNKDLARVIIDLKTLRDNMATLDELFPVSDKKEEAPKPKAKPKKKEPPPANDNAPPEVDDEPDEQSQEEASINDDDMFD